MPDTDYLLELLDVPGVSVRMERDNLGWVKLRVQWNTFMIMDAAFADKQIQVVLGWALGQVHHTKARNS